MIKNNNNINNYINYNSRVYEKDLQKKLNITNNNIYRNYIQKNSNILFNIINKNIK